MPGLQGQKEGVFQSGLRLKNFKKNSSHQKPNQTKNRRKQLSYKAIILAAIFYYEFESISQQNRGIEFVEFPETI
jgi:hypothetical protein